MPSLEKNQFLRKYFGSEARRDGVSPRTMEFTRKMLALLKEYADGWISEDECAVTAATAGAQWEMQKLKHKAAARPSVLSGLVLPANYEARPTDVG